MNLFESIDALTKNCERKQAVLSRKGKEVAEEIGKLEREPERTKEDAKRLHEFVKSASEIHQENLRTENIGNRAGIVSQIVKTAFEHKMASLLCHSLLVLSSQYRDCDCVVGSAVANGIGCLSDSVGE